MEMEKVWIKTDKLAPSNFPSDIRRRIEKSSKLVGFTDWQTDYDGYTRVKLKGGYVWVKPDQIERLKKNVGKSISRAAFKFDDDFFEIKNKFNF